MLRKLKVAVIGALLGAVAGLIPVIVEAQQLRRDSERDVVEVSRRVVGAEAVDAAAQNQPTNWWLACCAGGLGLLGGWLFWGRRHEPQAVLRQLESDGCDPEIVETVLAQGSLFGLTGAGLESADDSDSSGSSLGLSRYVLADSLQSQVVEGSSGSDQATAKASTQIVWGEYPLPTMHSFPEQLVKETCSLEAESEPEPERVQDEPGLDYMPAQLKRRWPAPILASSQMMMTQRPISLEPPRVLEPQIIPVDGDDEPWGMQEADEAPERLLVYR